jgi:uncharacterized lipoprotein YajG
MKRNLLTLLVAGLMLAACSKPDLVETPKADAIKTQAAGNITVAKDGTDVDVPVMQQATIPSFRMKPNHGI